MNERNSIVRQVLGISCVALLLLISAGAPLRAQEVAQDQESSQPPVQALTPEQLDAMVAPIALYPDGLLGQVLVAATYPLEVAEAAQWLRQDGNLRGSQLVDAARQQNWDPSIQALVAFPDVINRLNSDIRWTTDLGNAFLAQQADVMNAVQHLRAEARAAGKLNSNAQETVTEQIQGDQTAIDIQPADPQVVYVPTYNPEYIWGPPAYGYYPPLYYPAGFGFGFGPGIYLGGFFGGLGWGGWGWGCNWFGGGLFVNGFFFNHYGFHDGFRGYGGGRFEGRENWVHNPEHRMGVAYPNQRVASRFGGTSVGGRNFANRGNFGTSTAQRGSQFAGSRSQTSQPPSAARSSQGNGFRSSGSQGGSSYRPNPSYGSGATGTRSMPTYRPSSPATGNGYRSASPSGGSAYRPAPFAGGSGSRSATPSGGNAYRPAPFTGGSGYRSATPSGGNAYRPAPFTGGSGYRSAPSGGNAYRPAPSYGGGGGYRSAAPSGGSAYRSAPSSGSRSAAPSGGGSSFHGGGGGGSSHGGGGGSAHGGGHR